MTQTIEKAVNVAEIIFHDLSILWWKRLITPKFEGDGPAGRADDT